MALRRWYTGKFEGTPAFVKLVPAGVDAEREVATLRKLQTLPQCRVVRLLHAADVTLMEPHTRQVTAPHVALITALAPGDVCWPPEGVTSAAVVLDLLQVRAAVLACMHGCAVTESLVARATPA